MKQNEHTMLIGSELLLGMTNGRYYLSNTTIKKVIAVFDNISTIDMKNRDLIIEISLHNEKSCDTLVGRIGFDGEIKSDFMLAYQGNTIAGDNLDVIVAKAQESLGTHLSQNKVVSL